jgi:hypothetical protein
MGTRIVIPEILLNKEVSSSVSLLLWTSLFCFALFQLQIPQ